MSYILAILLPPLACFLNGKILTGLLLLVLMLTIVGWIPAAVIAVLVVNDAKADRRIKS